MAWSDARIALLDVLAGLGEITVKRRGVKKDRTVTVARVYEHPPASVRNFPAIVAVPPATTVERNASRQRLGTYTQSFVIRLPLGPDPDETAATADAIREAVIDAFDANTTLSGHASWIEGPEFEELGTAVFAEPVVEAVYAGKLTIHLQSTVPERSG